MDWVSPLLRYENDCAHYFTSLWQHKEVARCSHDRISIEDVRCQQVPLDPLLRSLHLFLVVVWLEHPCVVDWLLLDLVQLFENVLAHARVEHEANAIHAREEEVF